MHELHWLDQDDLDFPDPEQALDNPNGLLAIGGDLSPERLLSAYRQGIFPWYEGQPILWWTPDPRMVLFPDELHISQSLKKLLKKEAFQISSDRCFSEVIRACAQQRGKGREGTWITPAMQQAYIDLHQKGWAHSVEVWSGDELVGGLYGIAIGSVFFGESMFSKVDNASKVGFVTLVRHLQAQDFKIIDCQVSSSHLAGFGAREISRQDFMSALSRYLTPGRQWQNLVEK